MYVGVDDLSNWGGGEKWRSNNVACDGAQLLHRRLGVCGGSGSSAHITGHGRHRLQFHQSAFRGCIAAPTPLLPADVYTHLNGCYAAERGPFSCCHSLHTATCHRRCHGLRGPPMPHLSPWSRSHNLPPARGQRGSGSAFPGLSTTLRPRHVSASVL